MNKLSLSLIAALLAPAAFASDLNVNVVSGSQNTIKVAPGAAVPYSVLGSLSDNSNEGLAYFSFDLEFDGGALTQAATPGSTPMDNFANPLGLNNPAGFGGTVQGGKLIQVGGAQNTWNSTLAAVPTGTVITGVGKGAPVTLASGSLNAPLKVGTYHLVVTQLDANVINQGETGAPFWHTSRAITGTNTGLTITVSALSGTVTSLSISAPGTADVLSLNAGPAFAGRTFLMLGSFSGTTPGVFVNLGVKLPLNYDNYFGFLLTTPNPPILSNHVGVLNGSGKATCVWTMPANLRPALVGLTISHAYLLTPTNDFASDAQSFTLVP